MTELRFIHCSDLHIDSPFKGMSRVRPFFARKLREATTKAYENIIDSAIDENVDAVMIAGDIFDGDDKSLKAQLKFLSGLEKLAQAKIPVFIALGNHDSLESWSSSLIWPENVTLFPADRVLTTPLIKKDKLLAHVHGISFKEREVTENLSLRFPDEKMEGFNIGVLHTNVGGQKNHGNYAPSSLSDLIAKPMDYWALGHIHQNQILRAASPAIVYSGNTQGRHPNEPGEKGCYLVTLDHKLPPKITRVVTDTIRFINKEWDLTNIENINSVLSLLEKDLKATKAICEGRDLFIRATLKGASLLHDELNSPGYLEDMEESLGLRLEEEGISLSIYLKTQKKIDIESLSKREDFVANLIDIYSQAKKNPELYLESLKLLHQGWPGKKHLLSPSDEELSGFLDDAMHLTLQQLLRTD